MAKPDSYTVETPKLEGTHITLAELQVEGADEYVTIENTGTVAQPLTSWILASLRGETLYQMPEGLVLHPNSRVRIHSGPAAEGNPPTDFVWTRERVWNDKGDTAVLFDALGHEVTRLTHGSPPAESRGARLLYRDDDGRLHIEDSYPSKAVNRKLTTPSAEARKE
ncbi:MAG: lamin tail domain-containing protein [Ardenticatenaceae bacterium]|nr:lamin tail domain-containing protein [Ardenticatenaceae bacterium]HBY95055.1 hypothetical protein [Chloroflexota bacterium]